jgi:hypothetical protein
MKTNRLFWILFLAVRLSAQTITTQPTNQAVLAGGNVTFSVAVSGNSPFTYQWQFNGSNLTSDIITTVAGNGTNSFYGDAGNATNAGLYEPTSVAVDSVGNLFIADEFNSRIHKVNTNGIITTFADTGTNFFLVTVVLQPMRR